MKKIFLFTIYLITIITFLYLFLSFTEYIIHIIHPEVNPFSILKWDILTKIIFNIFAFFAIFVSIILTNEKFSKNQRICECPNCKKRFLLDLERDL